MAFVSIFNYIILQLVLVPFWIIITRSSSLHKRHEKNVKRKGRWLDVHFEERGYQSLLVIMASKKYASFNSGKYIFNVESTFLSILSIVESYVKSKCRALKLPLFTSLLLLKPSRCSSWPRWAKFCWAVNIRHSMYIWDYMYMRHFKYSRFLFTSCLCDS